MSDLTVKFKIRRQNPEIPGKEKPYWQEFTLTGVDPTDRVLEMLHRIKWEQDGTLSLRRSCAHGVCGSDAMRINGVNALACKVLVQDVGNEIMVEPILGLPVIKDLIVDMEPFFEHYRSVMPFFVNNDPAPADGRERLQTQEDKDKFDDTTKCILCACCSTSCPSYWWNSDKFLGPAILLQAYRWLADSRDEMTGERLDQLEDPFRLYRCHTIMNCANVCPKGLSPAKAIAETKKMIAERAI